MVFPEIEILVYPVVVDGISREDWYKTAEGRKVVLGEFSRMGQQLLMMELHGINILLKSFSYLFL